MRRRFFVEEFTGPSAVIEGDAAHHLGRVLRAQPGQVYELSDGNSVWLGRIELVDRNRVDFALLEQIPAHQPAVDITLLLSLVKFDAFEWAIEKATELGVTTIVPLATSRSEKALVAAAGKRSERWKKILLEASQQSRRVRVPFLESPMRPDQAFGRPQPVSYTHLDVITEINRQPVTSLDDYKKAVGALKPGENVVFKVLRHGDSDRTFTVFLPGVVPADSKQ